MNDQTSAPTPTALNPMLDTPWSAVLLTGAVILLGMLLQRTNGTLEVPALLMLTLSFFCLALSLLPFAPRWPKVFLQYPLEAVWLFGLVAFASLQFTTMPGVYLSAPSFEEHHRLLTVEMAFAVLLLHPKPVLGRLAFFGLLISALLIGLWLLRASPQPIIDVFVWHQKAYQALSLGANPYALEMPNIYGHTQWYAPGLATATTVNVGFPYPPLTLALGGIGHVLASDYRYANLAMTLASAGMMSALTAGRNSKIAAALFLLAPRGLFVLEQGWTEGSAIFMFCLTVFAAKRFPKALPWVFGLMLATKQYFVLLIPLAPLLLTMPRSLKASAQFLAKAGGVAALTVLPFFVWNAGAFWQSVAVFQSKQPFRADSLSFMAYTAQNGVPVIPAWANFASAVVAAALTWFSRKRGVASFSVGSAFIFLVFFAVSKQAFCNYYHLVFAMGCAALAALGSASSIEDSTSKTAPAFSTLATAE